MIDTKGCALTIKGAILSTSYLPSLRLIVEDIPSSGILPSSWTTTVLVNLERKKGEEERVGKANLIRFMRRMIWCMILIVTLTRQIFYWRYLSAFPWDDSRKIDKINNLAGLPGDGGEVLVGGKYGNLRQKMREFQENGNFTGEWGARFGLRLGKVTDPPQAQWGSQFY